MIRKGIIVVLTVAAVGTAIPWAASYWRHVSSGSWPGMEAGHSVSMTFKPGIVICTYFRREHKPLAPDQVDFLSNGHVLNLGGPHNFSSWGYYRGFEYVAYDIDHHDLEMSPPSMVHTRIVSVRYPSWLMFAVFATYPAITFIRGPLRRYRRRRRGLCLKCGYDLTGNVTGVCPECGTKVERP